MRPIQLLPLILGLSTYLGSGGTAFADDTAARSIERGVKYLIGLHQPAANYKGGSHSVGTASLAGLALLESNISPDDRALRNITAYVRANALVEGNTYETSLVVMFLDRLGEKVDRPAIQFLTVRLVGGQNRSAGWTYALPALTDAEAERVRKALYDERSDAAPDRLHPEAARLARAIAANPNRDETSDNSNTQFAILALWIGRKHGVQCDAALAAAEKRFRLTQTEKGAWRYSLIAMNLTGDIDSMPGLELSPAMTCAGLLALAASRGVQVSALRSKSSGQGSLPEVVAATNDKAVIAALKYLEKEMNKPSRAAPRPLGEGIESKDNLRDNIYFLWSLERVAVIYDLQKIGSVDWYQWGAQHLIKTQAEDGSWAQTAYTGANSEVNTAFALLFLNRANLAKDLTATLRGGTSVKLPDQVTNPTKVEPKAKVELPPASTAKADFDKEATRLANTLVIADVSNRGTILSILRESKGSVYTEALVRAIPRLKSEQQREVREALAQRLKRMTALTLREMLKDESREIRMAAAAACGLKEDKQFVPDLIAILSDSDTLVVQAARTSLRGLSQKDFGPNDNASADDKAKAIAAWRAWWMSQPK